MDSHAQQLEAELNQWETELENWRVEDEHATGDPQLRKEQQLMLDDLSEKRSLARHYLDQLAQGNAGEDLKAKMEPLWAEIRALITTIKQWA
jgi:hypothetical protein